MRTVSTIDLTPTPDAYRAMLRVIALDGENQASRAWALDELTRVGSVTEWGVQA